MDQVRADVIKHDMGVTHFLTHMRDDDLSFYLRLLMFGRVWSKMTGSRAVVRRHRRRDQDQGQALASLVTGDVCDYV